MRPASTKILSPEEWYFILPSPSVLRVPSSLTSFLFSVPVFTGASGYGSSQPLNNIPSSVDDLKTKALVHLQKRLEER